MNRMTPLGLALMATAKLEAERSAKADDFGFPLEEPTAPAITGTTDTITAPKTVAIFNVGNRYTIAPPTEPGKPEPKVRKVNNKLARRILRKRGNEGRAGRKVREAWAQKADARSVVTNSHEAARLLQAQRDYQLEQRNLEQAGVTYDARTDEKSGRFA